MNDGDPFAEFEEQKKKIIWDYFVEKVRQEKEKDDNTPRYSAPEQAP